MSRRRTGGLAALGVSAALAIAACSSGGGGSSSSSTTTSSVAFNTGVNSVVNPSTQKGGTLTFDNTSGPDSTDGGNTYYSFNLNFTRLYATPLTTYSSSPGSAGLSVVPALATSLGVASDGNKTWT